MGGWTVFTGCRYWLQVALRDAERLRRHLKVVCKGLQGFSCGAKPYRRDKARGKAKGQSFARLAGDAKAKFGN